MCFDWFGGKFFTKLCIKLYEKPVAHLQIKFTIKFQMVAWCCYPHPRLDWKVNRFLYIQLVYFIIEYWAVTNVHMSHKSSEMSKIFMQIADEQRANRSISID